MDETSVQRELAALQRQLEAACVERDAAVSALEQEQREAEDQRRLLVEEQDRFVTRIIDRHERQLAQLKGEHDEAVAIAEQLRQKLERLRKEALRAEENLALHRCESDKRKRELEDAKRTISRLMHEENPHSAHIAHLESELAIARGLLADALQRPSKSPNVEERAVTSGTSQSLVVSKPARASHRPTLPGTRSAIGAPRARGPLADPPSSPSRDRLRSSR